MSEESKEKSAPNQTIGGTQIVYLHLSDIFKTKPEPLDKDAIINEIKTHIGLKKGKMYIIKLNGSYCKYFRIKENTFSQEDFKDGGTFDDKGFLNLIPGTATPTVNNKANDGEVVDDDEGEVVEKKPVVEQEPVVEQDPENKLEDEQILVLLDENGEEEVQDNADVVQADDAEEMNQANKDILVLLNPQDGTTTTAKSQMNQAAAEVEKTVENIEKEYNKSKQLLEQNLKKKQTDHQTKTQERLKKRTKTNNQNLIKKLNEAVKVDDKKTIQKSLTEVNKRDIKGEEKEKAVKAANDKLEHLQHLN